MSNRRDKDEFDPWYKDALRARFDDYKKQSLAGFESWAGASDAPLVLRLLRGTTWEVPRSKRLPRMTTRYLTPAEEHKSRKALADLLRTRKRPAPHVLLPKIKLRDALLDAVCHRLADLIEIAPDDIRKRRVVLKNGKGQPRQDDANSKIFFSVERHVKDGLSVTEAVDQVHKKYGLSTRRIWEILALVRTEQ